MRKMYFVGQAPARSGDGRPFSGYSGQRLYGLLDLFNYDALDRRFGLENLLDRKAPKSPSGRGDTFDRALAERKAMEIVRRLLREERTIGVVACGHQVFRCFSGEPKPFYKGKTIRSAKSRGRLEVWNFPHPSGTSAYWNDRSNWLEAQAFLNRLVKRYGIDL